MKIRSFLYSHIPKVMLKPLYGILEEALIDQIKRGKIPSHIGIIMDGNRRFARDFGISPWKGHERGASKLEEILDWAKELGIKIVTIYAFSTENFKRSKEEVEKIMDLFEEKFLEIASDEKIHKNKVKVKAVGRLELLPPRVRGAIEKAERATESYDERLLNVCVSYGGRMELIDAFLKLSEKIKKGELKASEITEEVIKEHLYEISPNPDLMYPDLIIRTGGEVRLSNFLLFQAAYSELFFTEVYFPAFRKIDFLRILREFQKRKRRFGE
ncbi:MAG: polyprenyl diphosphate synthase [Candidatus Methanofastidiosia archaeon]